MQNPIVMITMAIMRAGIILDTNGRTVLSTCAGHIFFSDSKPKTVLLCINIYANTSCYQTQNDFVESIDLKSL